MRKRLWQIRNGAWLTSDRMTAYAWMLLLCEIAGFLFFVAGTHGLVVPLQRPTSSDFVSFYAAGRLADVGHGWLAYNHAAHYVAEQQATHAGIAYNYFYYPPVFLLVCAIFARLPYLAAFIAFQACTALPCLLVVRAILRDAKPIFLLAFPAVFWTMGTGQNAFLTASLLAAATWQIDRRPVLAGLLFGALCYKPHFGLLIPIALIAGGHGRAFASAAATVLALIGLSGWIFGWPCWMAFVQAMADSQSIYASHAIDVAGLTSPYGAIMALGQAPWRAAIVQGCVTLGAAILVAVIWRRRLSLPIRAAVLLAAIPVATPIVMFYDLMLSGVAIAWLVRAGRSSGFAPWSKTLLAISFVLPLLSGNVGGAAAHWLIAPLDAAMVLTVAAMAALRELRSRQSLPWPIAGSKAVNARELVSGRAL